VHRDPDDRGEVLAVDPHLRSDPKVAVHDDVEGRPAEQEARRLRRVGHHGDATDVTSVCGDEVGDRQPVVVAVLRLDRETPSAHRLEAEALKLVTEVDGFNLGRVRVGGGRASLELASDLFQKCCNHWGHILSFSTSRLFDRLVLF
jgi:hypothetical protein